MEKKEKQSRFQLLPVLLVCMLLACAGLVFAVYTHRELSWLRSQIREHEKIIKALQPSNNDEDIKESKVVRIQRSAQDSCPCVGAPGREERSENSENGVHAHLDLSGPTEFVCRVAADVAFLVDSSASIGSRNWRKMKQFLKDMIKAFNVGPDKTHIAVVTYNTEARAQFTFDAPAEPEIIEELIERMKYERGDSYIDKALILADKEVFTTEAGMRLELPKIAIIITDGKQTARRGPYTELSVASRGLRLKKVQLYSIGIGTNADLQQLANITGSKDKVFYADSFAALTPVAQKIVQNACPDERKIKPPASEKVVRASIYLAGDDTNLLNPVDHIISNWIVRDKIGSIQYDSRGFIIITTPGHYFIYSQMYYDDARTHVMAHHTYINNEKVMESIAGSSLAESTKDNTRYHGGVFLLRVNDTISVRIPYTRHYNMKTDASFFGAVLLYPAAGSGEER